MYSPTLSVSLIFYTLDTLSDSNLQILSQSIFSLSDALCFQLTFIHTQTTSRQLAGLPDWASFESSWQQICLQKQPKNFVDFWAIMKSIILCKLLQHLFGQLFETFGIHFCSNIWSHWQLGISTGSHSLIRPLHTHAKICDPLCFLY